MVPTRYRCTCSTCRHEEVAESYDAANEFFDTHASKGHEVEIVRREETATSAE